MITPVTPSQIEKKLPPIPQTVIQAVNNLILANYKNGQAIIRQNDVIKEITKLWPTDISTEDIFHRGYLNFESLFMKAGWKVEYDKPGFDESYEPFYTFSKKNGATACRNFHNNTSK